LDSGGDAFNNLTYTGIGTLQLVNSALTVNGTLLNDDDLNVGTAGDIDTNGLAVTAGTLTVIEGTFSSVAGGGTWDIGTGGVTIGASGSLTATSGTFTVAGNWANNGTFTNSSGTVTFDGGATQSVTSGGSAFNNFMVNGTGVQIQDALDVDGNLTLTAGDLDENGFDITVAGNWDDSGGGTFTAAGNTVTFDGAAGTHTLNAGNSTFNNLTVNGSSGNIVRVVSNVIDIGGNLEITSNNTFDLNGQSISNATLVNNGTFQLDGGNTFINFTTDTDSGRFLYVGDGGAGTLAVKDFGSLDYFNVEFSTAGSNTFQVTNPLDVEGSLTINSGTLDTNSNITVNGTLNLAGGTLVNGGTITVDGGTGTFSNNSTLSGGILSSVNGGQYNIASSQQVNFSNGVTVDGSVTLVMNNGSNIVVTNGLTLDGLISMADIGLTNRLIFSGTQTLGGTGTISFEGTGSQHFVQPLLSGNTLTIGSGITIQTGTGSGIIGDNNTDRFVLNQGTIISGTSGNNITIRVFTNEGAITVSNGGTLTFTRDWDNAASGTITIDGAGSLLTTGGLGDVWSNAGAINLNNNGRINLGGNFLAAEFESFTNDGTGLIYLSQNGVMNASAGLTLTATTGDLFFESTGTINGGTLSATDGKSFIVDVTGRFTGGVILDSSTTMFMNDGSNFTVTGGLTLDGTITLDNDGIGSITELRFDGSQTLGGTGTIFYGGTGSSNAVMARDSGEILTIGSGITIVTSTRGGRVGNSAGGRFVTNNGTITSNLPGFTLTLYGVTNESTGIVEALSGGNISLQTGSLSNNGTYTVGTGSTILTNNGNLTNNAGGFIKGTGTINEGSGTLVNNGGTIQPGGAGSVGTLTITGDFTQTSGVIEIEINDSVVAAGTNYDLLSISGQADLLGTLTLLDIGAYVSAEGDVLTPLTYGSNVNVFTTINGTGTNTIAPTYNATTLDLLTSFALYIFNNNGLWSTATNWDSGIVPDSTVNADIESGFTATVNSAESANALTGAGNLTITAGSLTLDGDSSLAGTLTISGGTLTGAGDIILDGAFNWSGGTLGNKSSVVAL